VADDNSQKLKELREDFKKTFSTEEGKRVLKALESQCLFKTSVFDKDSHLMAYQAGRRDVFLSIISIMELEIEELEKIANARGA